MHTFHALRVGVEARQRLQLRNAAQLQTGRKLCVTTLASMRVGIAHARAGALLIDTDAPVLL